MALEFKLPDIGEGIAEGEIVQWMVEPGQAVQEEDPFVEVMTDKATVTITVPWSGTVPISTIPVSKTFHSIPTLS